MLADDARRLAEYHVAGPGKKAVRAGVVGAYNDVGEAIAVDVPGRGDREAAVVARRRATDLETGGAVQRSTGRR